MLIIEDTDLCCRGVADRCVFVKAYACTQFLHTRPSLTLAFDVLKCYSPTCFTSGTVSPNYTHHPQHEAPFPNLGKSIRTEITF